MTTLISLSVVLIAGTLASASFAGNLSCSPVLWQPFQSNSPYLTVSLTSNCTLNSASPLTISSMSTLYKKFLASIPGRFSIKKTDLISQEGELSREDLLVHEVRSTSHGRVNIDGTIILRHDREALFTYEYTSKTMVGEDNAQYSRFERFAFDLQSTGEASYRLSFRQTNTFEVPWFIPNAAFVSRATKGIEEELIGRRDEQVRILTKL